MKKSQIIANLIEIVCEEFPCDGFNPVPLMEIPIEGQILTPLQETLNSVLVYTCEQEADSYVDYVKENRGGLDPKEHAFVQAQSLGEELFGWGHYFAPGRIVMFMDDDTGTEIQCTVESVQAPWNLYVLHLPDGTYPMVKLNQFYPV